MPLAVREWKQIIAKVGNALGFAGKEDTWWFIIENNIFKWRWVPAVPYMVQVDTELEDEDWSMLQ